jgi:hypothetical protein
MSYSIITHFLSNFHKPLINTLQGKGCSDIERVLIEGFGNQLFMRVSLLDFKLSPCSVCTETSAIKHHTPENNPKGYTRQSFSYP